LLDGYKVIGKKRGAGRMARALLVVYALATVPLTALFSLFMTATGL
jgi:hypothetical protein